MNSSTTLEEFKTDFNINTDISDVNFRKLEVQPYNALPQNHQFGEKTCLLHNVELTIFNINASLRILAFKYDSHAEVLKLEITVDNELFSQEIAPCKNFLQRRRNINLMFELLIKFAQLFEMRRLICLTVFDKQRQVKTTPEDGVISVKFCKDYNRCYLELNWSITWKVDTFEIGDFIEFYLNYSVTEKVQASKVKQILEILVAPNIDFQLKLKGWKSVMVILYGCAPELKNSELKVDVLEISDSDSEDSVIEVDESVIELDTNHQVSNTDEITVID